MNDNDKTSNQEQERPITQWPGYAHLVLAFSILFSLVVLLGGVYVLRGMTDSDYYGLTGILRVWADWRGALVALVFLIPVFFAGAFAFLALKVKTEQGEAAGKAAVLVCRILFYPVHVVVRVLVRLGALVLSSLALAAGLILAHYSYIFLVPEFKEFGHNVLIGTSLVAMLVSVLPNIIASTAGRTLGNIKKIIGGVSDLSLFPEMVVKESWRHTKDAVEKIEKEILWFIANVFLLILFSLLVVASFAAFAATVPEKSSTPAVQEKTSYIFLRNMPWIVGNVQSFFSSAVVFPMDAMPQDLSDESRKGAVRLSDADKDFYAAIYGPLLVDLARCGAPGKPVKIELSGFSSSSSIKSHSQSEEIKKRCPNQDNKVKSDGIKDPNKMSRINQVFNLCVAETRAEYVRGMLASFVKEKNIKSIFDFTVNSWGSLDEMRYQTEKIYCDGPKRTENRDKTGAGNGKEAQSCLEKYDRTRGLMNRRVDIAIVETPYCMI